MRLRLRHGVTADQALAALRPLIMEAGNIASAGSTPGGVPALRDAYLLRGRGRRTAAHVSDPRLGGHRNAPDAAVLDIRQVQSRMDARPAPLVEAEVAWQRGALEELVADLQARVDRLSANGTIAVLDTNILLQYEEPSKVPWRDVLAVQSVRLIVPLRVVEELDAKKYSGSRLAERRTQRWVARG
jgi:hypothetical protein